MRLAIVMLVVLQNERILAMTLDAIAHLKTVHEATLYIICNRLHVCTPETLYTEAQSQFSGAVNVIHEAGVERSVAGAWNKGCQLAVDAGNDFIAIVANDTQLRHDCLDQLVEYGKSHEADLWSGISCNNRNEIDASAQTDGADFSCFMTRPATLRGSAMPGRGTTGRRVRRRGWWRWPSAARTPSWLVRYPGTAPVSRPWGSGCTHGCAVMSC